MTEVEDTGFSEKALPSKLFPVTLLWLYSEVSFSPCLSSACLSSIFNILLGNMVKMDITELVGSLRAVFENGTFWAKVAQIKDYDVTKKGQILKI